MTRLTALSALAATVLVSGCVKDPAVEDEVAPTVGVSQPRSDGGATVGAADACHELVSAERSARSRLGCGDAGVALTCPNYVFLVGAVPCDEYVRSTVESCVTTMGAYTSCQDFDTKPCVVTVIRRSCAAPVPATDGGRDGSVNEVPDASSDASGKPPLKSDAAVEAGADASRSSDAGHD